jgi:ferredoxin-NADP reductase
MRRRYTARLVRKQLLSGPQQCFHLEFAVEGTLSFEFLPGQFVSCVATDSRGKQQTRAYSLASAPHGNQFDLCLNRVEGGFFSNFLCDLKPGDPLTLDEPMGDFTLQPAEPVLQRHNLFIATGTGVAPFRGFLQWLFPKDAPQRRPQTQFTLIYGTRHATELYYRDEFEELARLHENFQYIPTLSRADAAWGGKRGYVQEHAAQYIADLSKCEISASTIDDQARGPFDRYAYVCGFREMIQATRRELAAMGWARRQILAERYD